MRLNRFDNKNCKLGRCFVGALCLFLLPNLCYSYTYPYPFPYASYPFSIISYFFHKSYPDDECTPQGLQTQTLKLSYSQRTQNSNEFHVGWDIYTEKELASYQKPSIGGEVLIARCLPPGKWVFLGRGNVNGINGITAEATISGIEPQEMPPGKFPREYVETGNVFWRPMAGDSVFPVQKNITQKISITPKFEISSQEIFVSLGLNQYSYDISEQGEEILKQKFLHFKNQRGRIAVEGFILTSGNREELRVESLIRAQAVAKYLVSTFNLDPSQVVAFGYGNDWLQTGMQPIKGWPNKNTINGIIIKKMPNGY